MFMQYTWKNFSKAAKKLFISQPALSATIKKDEERIQVSIFDRSSNPIQLTPAGKYYIKSIEKIMEIQKEMESYFSAISKEKNGTINIGSSAFFCAHILPSIVYEFKVKYPSYNVNILETNVEEAIN
jgi:DNA-binding transcriptional LysR family regulator